MDIRMIAHKMGLDPDSAESLAKEVGDELAGKVLEKIQKKLDFQETLKSHPNKRSPDWFWGQEAHNCRLEFRARNRRNRLSSERQEYARKSQESYNKGYRATVDELYGQLEDGLEDAEKLGGETVSYEDFQKAKKFLDSLEEQTDENK